MFPSIPLKGWLIAGSLAAVLAATGASAWIVRGWQADAAINALTARYASDKAIATEAVRAELQAEVVKQAGIANDAKTKLEQAGADLAAADTAAGGLRDRVAALLASARRAAPATSDSAAAGDPLGVLADVLDRADKRAGVLADYADRARIAGLACEASYQALTDQR